MSVPKVGGGGVLMSWEIGYSPLPHRPEAWETTGYGGESGGTHPVRMLSFFDVCGQSI